MAHEAFQQYRHEDQHECTLLSARVNALLWSQSLFLSAWAILLNNSHYQGVKFVMVLIGMLAITLAGFAFLAIKMSCRILTKWHLHGQRLIEQDLALPESERQLPDFHLNRRAPDPEHYLSINLFGLSMPIVFVVFWICTICYTLVSEPLPREPLIKLIIPSQVTE
jgi:hypothetical protein